MNMQTYQPLPETAYDSRVAPVCETDGGEGSVSNAPSVSAPPSFGAHLNEPFAHIAGSSDTSACAGKPHGVILIDGIDVFRPDRIALSNVNWSRLPKGFKMDAAFWSPWMDAVARHLDGQVGFILLEAKTASSGADELHRILAQLAVDHFTGQVSVVAHSNGASALFLYMARAERQAWARHPNAAFVVPRRAAGDAAIASFVAMDMPTQVGLTGWWSGASVTTIAWRAVRDYMLNTHARGLYASNRRDLIALLPPPPFVPLSHYYVSKDASWDLHGVHTWLVDHEPSEVLLRFLFAGTSSRVAGCA